MSPSVTLLVRIAANPIGCERQFASTLFSVQPAASGFQTHEDYFWRPFLADVSVGAVVLIVIFAIAMRLGGFSFILPWAIVTPPLVFLAGWLRGRSAGNLWIKSASINAGALAILIGSSNTLTFALGAGVMVLSTAGGIALRRRSIGQGVINGDAPL